MSDDLEVLLLEANAVIRDLLSEDPNICAAEAHLTKSTRYIRKGKSDD